MDIHFFGNVAFEKKVEHQIGILIKPLELFDKKKFDTKVWKFQINCDFQGQIKFM